MPSLKQTLPWAVGIAVVVVVPAIMLAGPADTGSESAETRPLAPAWVKQAQRVGSTMVVTIEAGERRAGQDVPAFGETILRLARSYRDGEAAIPDGVERFTIYSNETRLDAQGQYSASETVLRANFDRAKLVAAAPPLTSWTVFQSADDVSATPAGVRAGIMAGVCDTAQGRSAGNLCG